MSRYTAIFLDRDGVISRNSPRKEAERDQEISALIGQSLHIDNEVRMRYFWQVWDLPGYAPVTTVETEARFWQRWYQCILEDYQVADAERIAQGLYARYAFHQMMECYPETTPIVRTLHERGFRLGVISDTFPSLEESLKHMGVAQYFSSFTASSLVGVGKPDPRIFTAALHSLGVTADTAIFVDDCLEEADGARDQGFTAFHMDRTLTEPDFARWEIGDLEHLLSWLDFACQY